MKNAINIPPCVHIYEVVSGSRVSENRMKTLSMGREFSHSSLYFNIKKKERNKEVNVCNVY